MTPADIRRIRLTALTPIQIRMLEAEVVGYDAWVKPDQIAAIEDLISRGFMAAEDIGSDEAQYTYIRCQITDAGRAALATAKKGGGHDPR